VNGDGRTLHPYAAEQDVLRGIRECREAQRSLRAIAAELTRRRFTTRAGTPFRFENVRGIVRTMDIHAPA
jgi:hypothetical protein